MVAITKKQLKASELPPIPFAKFTPEQVRIIAEVIYKVLNNTAETDENETVQ